MIMYEPADIPIGICIALFLLYCFIQYIRSYKDREKHEVKNIFHCHIQHWNTKEVREIDLIRDEDDCKWRTVDDYSELGYDWNVIKHFRNP